MRKTLACVIAALMLAAAAPSQARATCTVTVTPAPVPVTGAWHIHVDGLRVNQSDLMILITFNGAVSNPWTSMTSSPTGTLDADPAPLQGPGSGAVDVQHLSGFSHAQELCHGDFVAQ